MCMCVCVCGWTMCVGVECGTVDCGSRRLIRLTAGRTSRLPALRCVARRGGMMEGSRGVHGKRRTRSSELEVERKDGWMDGSLTPSAIAPALYSTAIADSHVKHRRRRQQPTTARATRQRQWLR
ncbi:hypothetical protein B0T19DRAFT_435553 [Cercophora scortea]|uniref:Secreted protein n=1 Tax=Cercophora scortea TaxID=314031 RepID=A0AAE0I376_9PEZI|nr:hypothetical protein B0T19DRAFT_435553 [Cercophora scortea]